MALRPLKDERRLRLKNKEYDMDFKNYKTWISFFTFLISFIYSVFSGKPEPVVYTTGLFFLVVTIAFMLRSDQLLELIKAFVERFKNNA